MNKSLRLEYAISYKRLLAFLFDLLSAAILTVALFFLGLLCIGEPAFKYSSSKKEMKAIENSYSLNLGNGKSYTEYEAALHPLDLLHTEPVRQRSVDIHGLPAF